jgi:hypothetical protein
MEFKFECDLTDFSNARKNFIFKDIFAYGC